MNRRNFVDMLAESINYLIQIPAREKTRIIRAIRSGDIEFRKPEELISVLKPDERNVNHGLSFETFRCPKCGKLTVRLESKIRVNSPPMCQQDNVRMVQAYVFTPYILEPSQLQSAISNPSKIAANIIEDPNSTCPMARRNGERKYKLLVSEYPFRPIDSLAWHCPPELVQRYPDCPYRGRFIPSTDTYRCLARRYGRNIQTSSGPVRPRLRIGGSRMGIAINSAVTEPTERATKNLLVNLHFYRERDVRRLDHSPLNLKNVDEVLHVRRLEVYQIAIGYLLGYPRSPTYMRAFYSWKTDDGRYIFYANRIETEGIVVKLSDSIERELGNPGSRNSDTRLAVYRLLHTMAHAFTLPLPMVTGLNITEFWVSIDPISREFAVYDSSAGGIGGIRSVIEGNRLNVNYVELVKRKLSGVCPLNCTKGCKACLFMEHCKDLNRNLDKRLLRHVYRG